MKANRKRVQVHRVENITNEGSAWGELLTTTFGKPQHLYFTTDEEIKEGDSFINTNFQKIYKANSENSKSIIEFGPYPEIRKIIATTDILLIEDDGYTDHLPQPSQALIKAYCVQGGFDEVDVEMITAGTWKEHKTSERIGQICTTCNEYEYGGPSECDCGFKLKVNSDNTITTHRIVEKMYSKDEMISFVKYAIKNGFGLNHIENLFDKWIKENL